MDNTILKLATLKISAHFNVQRLIEEHNKVLDYAKDNGTTETFEELDKLRQILEDKKCDAMEIVEEQDMLPAGMARVGAVPVNLLLAGPLVGFAQPDT